MTGWHKSLGAALAAGVLLSGCRKAEPPPKPAPPSKATYTPQEGKLNTVELTPEAEERLGLKTEPIERRAVPRRQSYGGEVTLPPGALLTVSAPVTGTLQAPKGQAFPRVGSPVDKGRAMFALVPHVLTQAEQVSLTQAKLQLAQARIDAEGQVKQAQVQVEAARINVERAERLFREQAGTKKDVDDATAQMHLAQKSLEAALQRKAAVDGMQLDTDTATVKPLPIPSPLKGVVRAAHAVAGEMVPAGAPLFEVMDFDTVWVRVPLYVGEQAAVAEKEPARVTDLAGSASQAGVAAKPVLAPPTAQAQASAVDLYYELPNPGGKYRPGERVGVLLTLKGEEESPCVNWAAVVHDINGGSWVYVKTGEHAYARQRVQVRYVSGETAVLAEAPSSGAKVVTAGAAELFGAEFGFGK